MSEAERRITKINQSNGGLAITLSLQKSHADQTPFTKELNEKEELLEKLEVEQELLQKQNERSDSEFSLQSLFQQLIPQETSISDFRRSKDFDSCSSATFTNSIIDLIPLPSTASTHLTMPHHV